MIVKTGNSKFYVALGKTNIYTPMSTNITMQIASMILTAFIDISTPHLLLKQIGRAHV